MTQKEVRKIAKIARGAHCVGCTRRFCDELMKSFPEFNWWKIVADLNPEYWTEKFLRDND